MPVKLSALRALEDSTITRKFRYRSPDGGDLVEINLTIYTDRVGPETMLDFTERMRPETVMAQYREMVERGDAPPEDTPEGEYQAELFARQRGRDEIYETLTRVIKEWDIVGDDDQPIAVTTANLRSMRLSMPFLERLSEWFREQIGPNQRKPKSSGGGWPRRVK